MYFVYLKEIRAQIFQEMPKADCAVLPKLLQVAQPSAGIMCGIRYAEDGFLLRFVFQILCAET